jgi:glutathione S-transferase
MPRLFHFPLCPFSRRIRLTLGELDLDAELNEELPWKLSAGVMKLNPAGALPVLVEDNRAAIAGVEAVSEYLEETRVPADSGRSMLGKTPVERAEVRRLVAWFDVKFHREVSRQLLIEKIDRRFAGPEHGGGAPNMTALRASRSNIRTHLDYIGGLAETRRWLGGDHLSSGDLAAAAHLSCIDYLGDVPWSANAAAKEWYVRVKSRPSFRPLLADQIRGMPPPRIYADLDF